ncbi:MAG: lipocalin family protein [Ignavibacteriaceae bacterium]|nr:lipocalin family protein [Ignavibacteriaceae bacterium]
MKHTILFLSLFFFAGCSSTNYPPLETVSKVDVNRYMGKWYEIARLPFDRQKHCTCTTAEYAIIDNETISVLNSCRDTVDNELSTAEGKAFVVEGSNNAKLKVQFFWPFKGDYWVIDLDTLNYSYALVGMPSRKYAWILSRTPVMDPVFFQRAVNHLRSTGFDVERLIETKQGECR